MGVRCRALAVNTREKNQNEGKIVIIKVIIIVSRNSKISTETLGIRESLTPFAK